jgi:hypothetical protein
MFEAMIRFEGELPTAKTAGTDDVTPHGNRGESPKGRARIT